MSALLVPSIFLLSYSQTTYFAPFEKMVTYILYDHAYGTFAGGSFAIFEQAIALVFFFSF